MKNFIKRKVLVVSTEKKRREIEIINNRKRIGKKESNKKEQKGGNASFILSFIVSRPFIKITPNQESRCSFFLTLDFSN